MKFKTRISARVQEYYANVSAIVPGIQGSADSPTRNASSRPSSQSVILSSYFGDSSSLDILGHHSPKFLRTLQNARYSEGVIYQERPRDLARRRRSNLASIPHRHGAGYGQGAPARTDREEYPSAPLDESYPQTGTAHPAEEFAHPHGAYLSGEHEGWL